MSFKDSWKSFSTEDKQNIAFWTANAALWGGMSAGMAAVTASVIQTVPEVVGAEMMMNLSSSVLGFSGMVVAAASGYKAAGLNAKLKKYNQDSLSTLQKISNNTRTRFRDKWKAMSRVDKIKTVVYCGTAVAFTALAAFTAGAGLSTYAVCADVAFAAGCAVAGVGCYENAQKTAQLAIAPAPSTVKKPSVKSRTKQRTLDLTMEPQTLQTVKNRVYKSQKPKTAAKKTVESDSLIKMVRDNTRQDVK